MAYFTPDLIAFLTELGENNSKEWFDENRKRYEKNVRNPFKAFVTELIDEMREEDPSIEMEAKHAIFRINRDIRFSKDKTPYKTHLGAVVNPGLKRNPKLSGYYLEINPERVRFYGGAYWPEKKPLQRIREEIMENGNSFREIISEKKFAETFGEVKGDKNKVLPKVFKEAAKEEPLLFNKGFYVFHDMPTSVLYEEDLIERIMELYDVVRPFAEFLRRPIEG